MTTTNKYLLWIAVIAIIVIVFRKQIGEFFGMGDASTKKTVDNTIEKSTTNTIVQPIIVPVGPDPRHIAECDKIAMQIRQVKAKMAQELNPIQKAAFQRQLDGLNQQYINMRCISVQPPANPNPTA